MPVGAAGQGHLRVTGGVPDERRDKSRDDAGPQAGTRVRPNATCSYSPGILPDNANPSSGKLPAGISWQGITRSSRTPNTGSLPLPSTISTGASQSRRRSSPTAEMERARHRGGDALGPVVQHVDQRRQARHVQQQHELVPLGVRDLARAFGSVDAGWPFGMAQVHLPCKGVQMTHKTGHYLAQARIGVLAHAGDVGLGDRVLGDGAPISSGWQGGRPGNGSAGPAPAA